MNSTKLLKQGLCALFCAGLLFTTGCQTSIEETTVASSPEYWSAMQQKLQQVKSYTIAGRIGMSGAARFSANFKVTGAGDDYKLVLTSSFGNILAELKVNADGAVLTADGRSYEDVNANNLLLQVFQLQIPVQQLKPIVLGLIGPASIIGPDGQLMNSVYDGFIVTYSKFSQYNGFALPSDFLIDKGDIHIKVKVSGVESIE